VVFAFAVQMLSLSTLNKKKRKEKNSLASAMKILTGNHITTLSKVLFSY